jgi:GH24 family phage-related lysozyme (muramidase)
VVPGKRYSLQECDALLTDDMRKAVAQVAACVPDAPVPVLAAFADAAFNLGPKIACDTTASTAARKLNARDWSGACDELPKWNKARIAGQLVALPGLTKRRWNERALCLQWGAK